MPKHLLLKPMFQCLTELSKRCMNDRQSEKFLRITLSNKLGKRDILIVLTMASSDRLEAFMRGMNKWEQRAPSKDSKEASNYSRQTPLRLEMKLLLESLMSKSNPKVFIAFTLPSFANFLP